MMISSTQSMDGYEEGRNTASPFAPLLAAALMFWMGVRQGKTVVWRE
jgi:hypothetical protein